MHDPAAYGLSCFVSSFQGYTKEFPVLHFALILIPRAFLSGAPLLLDALFGSDWLCFTS